MKAKLKMNNLRIVKVRQWADTYNTGDSQSWDSFDIVRDFEEYDIWDSKRTRGNKVEEYFTEGVIKKCVVIENVSTRQLAKFIVEGLRAKKRAENKAKKKQMSNQTFARKCDVTGEGMNEGYVFGDDYFKYEKDALTHAISLGYKDLQASYDDDAHYYTEWGNDDHQYVEVNGTLKEIQE
jgi:hypothetical protein